MMRLLSFIFSLGVVISAWAQPFGNEWIDHGQSYYKFGVSEKGIYRISYATLEQAGIPVATIQPSQYQIFGKEKEIPLFVEDGGDGSFDNGDYIEFVAEGNDGWLDSLLYDNPEDIGNPAYSLYNDTLNYFLTWTTGSTERFVEETATNFSVFTPADYVWQKSIVDYNSFYYGGFSQNKSFSSYYSPGEGWGSDNYNGASDYTKTIAVPTPSLYDASGAPNVDFHAKSNANSNASYTGQGNHHLVWEIGSNNLELHNEVFTGYRQTVVNESVPTSELNDGTTDVFFKIIGDQGAATDFQSVNYLSIEYPRTPDMDNASTIDVGLENNAGQAKVRLDLQNADLSSPSFYVTGGDVPRKIPFVNNSGVWQGLIPNSIVSNRQQLYGQSAAEITEINSLAPVNGNGTFTDYSAGNVDDAYILIYHESMTTSASEYANYRSSPQGGNYNVVMCEVGDLSMQFGGGVPRHILGIRRLARYIYNLSTNKPRALFLAGKGITEASDPNTGSGGSARKNPSVAARNLVPSYGYPSGDVCITGKWDGTPNSWRPAIPTGRIAANNNLELRLYLEKIKSYELAQNQNDVYNKPNKEWQKQVLHFGGGINGSEQALFRNYLNTMKGLIEYEEFGGNVTSYFKQTSNPFNPVLTTEVNDHLENGVSLMTFFGHATANGFDQSIDDPSNWNNGGKYPMVIGNGCYTGDIFKSNNVSTSEDFVLIENLGAIGFISSVKLGFASYLNQYSNELYHQMSPDNYGATMGDQVQQTIAEVEGVNSNFLMESTVTQMTLHGDPALRLNWHGQPEIDLTQQDVFFEPQDINLETDSLTVNVVLTNLGKSITDTFSLMVERDFPNASFDSIYQQSINGLHYKDTFAFTMPVQSNIGMGMNQFRIAADLPSFIPELYDEFGNNEISTNFFVDIDGILPVLPDNYAVVPDDSVVVKASTINPTASFNTYRFELDTTDTFDSPFHRYAIKSGTGGVYEVFPDEWTKTNNGTPAPLNLSDSTVCFWRVAIDSSVLNWNEYSFQYIPGKKGWGQDHFFQFKNGAFSGIEYDRSTRKRSFTPLQASIECQVYDNASNNQQFNDTKWSINGQMAEYNLCSTTPSLHVAVIDPATMDPWGTYYNGTNADHQFGNVNNNGACRNRVEYYFIFRQNSQAQLQALDTMIQNKVPEGHYILIYSSIRGEFDDWENEYPNLFSTMQSMGSDSIQIGRDNRAFIFFTKKGDPSTTQEVFAQYPGEFLTFTETMSGVANFGVERSTVIGPAAEWETLYWKQSPEEVSSMDSTQLLIQGLDAQQNVINTVDTLFTLNDSILNLNNLFSASQYPYLRLEANYVDSTDFTPAQIDRWHVLYQPLPEAAIDGSNGYVMLPEDQDSLQEGVEKSFAIDVKNISDLDMDSMLVHYWVTDEDQNVHPIPYDRQDSLKSGEVLRDTVHFSTVGLGGKNTLWMEVNPYVNGTQNQFKDQPELTHFNNLLQLPFTLSEDDVNPILDVTFDGTHILNGDIVSPRAEVVMALKDENPFLVMNEDADTSNFGVFLTSPDGEQRRIPFIDGQGNQIMQWIPADDDNLRFKILYNADFEQSGTYKLLVQGSDNAGNLSGDLEYQVEFEVIHESSITHLMNYPNPFSTQTRFVFTLTGSRVPDEMIIQIMTVSGRIVREITEDELGPIRIGRNITSYAWDGRDEFGDPLANGVYLYRVKAQIDGESIKHRSSGADKHFKKNWGKMYLMR
ncbi:MAG: C25 family cysteine peptidase [Bacteroidota bacterium]